MLALLESLDLMENAPICADTTRPEKWVGCASQSSAVRKELIMKRRQKL
jgi:hypothetical protein